MSTNTPWFRFYSEALSDRKITRVCAMTRQPKVVILGMWTALLSMANDSPERGVLLIGDDLPLTLDEIFYEVGIDPETGQIIISVFVQVGMVSIEGGVYYITHWDDRQFASDNSTDRVRKFRENKRRQAQAAEAGDDSTDELETVDEVTEAGDGNATDNESDDYKKRFDETEVKRFSNVIDTESETESTPNGVAEKSANGAGKQPSKSKIVDKDPPTAGDLLNADTPLKQIMGTFLAKTGMSMPRKRSDQGFWWSEVKELFHIASDDTIKCQELVEKTIDEMKREKLSVVSPKSIVGTARRLAGETNGTQNGVVASY